MKVEKKEKEKKYKSPKNHETFHHNFNFFAFVSFEA